MPEIGVPDVLITHAIDVRAFVGAKRAAIAAHRSQWPPDHFMRRIPPALAERLWAYEFFSRVPSSAFANERNSVTLAERLARGELETDLFNLNGIV